MSTQAEDIRPSPRPAAQMATAKPLEVEPRQRERAIRAKDDGQAGGPPR
jgi:hypothetical protein